MPSSMGERMPFPAADISGVIPSAEGSLGSAPSSSSSRINGASLTRAAIRSGVASIRLTYDANR